MRRKETQKASVVFVPKNLLNLRGGLGKKKRRTTKLLDCTTTSQSPSFSSLFFLFQDDRGSKDSPSWVESLLLRQGQPCPENCGPGRLSSSSSSSSSFSIQINFFRVARKSWRSSRPSSSPVSWILAAVMAASPRRWSGTPKVSILGWFSNSVLEIYLQISSLTRCSPVSGFILSRKGREGLGD